MDCKSDYRRTSSRPFSAPQHPHFSSVHFCATSLPVFSVHCEVAPPRAHSTAGIERTRKGTYRRDELGYVLNCRIGENGTHKPAYRLCSRSPFYVQVVTFPCLAAQF